MVSIPDPAPTHWVRTPAALDEWLRAGHDQPLALDTEFERISTFFPIPGLVQLGLGDRFCLVDPSVAEQSAEFKLALSDPDKPKLLYAMSEDLELFRHWLGIHLEGVLDLQIGAALAGAGFSVGYARLVETLFGHALDKSATRSDWLARPLTPEQERYALDDVRFLKPLYHWIIDKLALRQLQSALAEESSRFAEELNRQSDPDQHYQKLRGGWQLNARQQRLLQILTGWREEECRRRDRPRNRVLADSALIAIAEGTPSNTGTLASLRDVPPVVVRRYGDTLIDLVRQAPSDVPNDFTAITTPLTRDEQGTYKKIKRVLAVIAEQHDVPIEILAPRRRLESLVKSRSDIKMFNQSLLFEGWRAPLTAPVTDNIKAILAS
ncbi:ribonuclease D [Marinobacter caseinilyticus]|uniref:ribonuclease D n=1 Tax=Marinobacter caseinilyticus TaxID=2692195 RepID=UPI00140E5D7B|nr:HRDC domain-containing protein [Marinobacter caseinilyticus]